MQLGARFISILVLASLLTVASPLISQQPNWDVECKRALGSRSGTAVVLDVASGRILGAVHREILGRRVAAPGSTVKPFVLQLAIENHRIDPLQTFACRRTLTISGKQLNCSHPQIGPEYDAREALALSCNSYFAAVGYRLQPGELERRLRALGFASPTGLIANEATGRVADAKTLEQRQLLALGVEGVEVTPIELAVAYMKLARADETSAHRVVFDGLAESTEQGLGKLATPDNLRISGKTGTARDSDGTGTHAWFVGFAPAKSPQIVVLVFLESGRGSTDAAVVARELFQFYADAHR